MISKQPSFDLEIYRIYYFIDNCFGLNFFVIWKLNVASSLKSIQIWLKKSFQNKFLVVFLCQIANYFYMTIIPWNKVLKNPCELIFLLQTQIMNKVSLFNFPQSCNKNKHLYFFKVHSWDFAFDKNWFIQNKVPLPKYLMWLLQFLAY